MIPGKKAGNRVSCKYSEQIRCRITGSQEDFGPTASRKPRPGGHWHRAESNEGPDDRGILL